MSLSTMFTRPSILFFLACISVTSFAVEQRDFYSEPGLNPFKDSINQNFNEHIDPFSGTLQLKYTDLSIPGNGGMDINIHRVYTSIAKDQYPMRTVNGFGWTMHFGRIVTTKDNVEEACNQRQTENREFTNDNPSLERSDGGRELLVLSNLEALGDAHNVLVTKTNWKAECVEGGWLVTSPSGTKYTMDEYDLFQGEPSWFTTRIEDLNGNWIEIEYDRNEFGISYITDVYRSEEGRSAPVVTFDYNDIDTSTITLKSISANGQTWEYGYESMDGFLFDPQQLVTVTRPDNKSWTYQYNPRIEDPDPEDGIDEDGLGSYSIKKVIYPYGAEIDYTYQWVVFDQMATWFSDESPFYGYANAKTLAIHTKSVSGPLVEDGTWTYDFAPHSHFWIHAEDSETGIPNNLLPLYLDVTTVTSPVAETKYYHFGKSFAAIVDAEGNTESWAAIQPHFIGLKAGEVTSSLSGTMLERRRYNWEPQKISDEQFWMGGRYSNRFKAYDPGPGTYRMNLVEESVDRDIIPGSDQFLPVFQTYNTKKYLDYDEFGNPGRIIENYSKENSAEGISSRSTRISYVSDLDKWWLSNVDTRSVYEYYLQTDVEEAEPASHIDYDYNDSGNLRRQEENGIVTEYTYTSEGDLETVTDELDNVIRYQNYRRGIARNEIHPENITLSRNVNSTGTVSSQTNGRDYTTHFDYDDLNRLTRIDYPIHDDVVIRYIDHTRQLTRGNYQQIEDFDSFGRLLRTLRRDIANLDTASIVSAVKYDELGRKIFQTQPYDANESMLALHALDPTIVLGVQFEYDALGRLKRKTNSDQSFVTFEYERDKTTVKNERDIETVSFRKWFGITYDGPMVETHHDDGQITTIQRNVLNQPEVINQGSFNPDDGLYYVFSHHYSYNDKLQLTKYTSPEIGDTDYLYDEVGNLQFITVGDSVTEYVYDNLYRQTDVIYSDEDTNNISTVYDKNGNATSVTKGNTSWSYVYDENDNLTTETLTVNPYPEITREYQIVRTFNALDHIESLTYPSNLVVNYATNALGQPTQVSEFASDILFHPSGSLKSYKLSNGIPVEIDLNDRMFTRSVKAGEASSRIVDLEYTYGLTGNVTAIEDNINALQSIHIDESAGYDAQDRLLRASGAWGETEFAYDSYGNIRWKKDGDDAFNVEYLYDNTNKLAYTQYSYQAGSEVTVSTSYEYDNFGNIVYIRDPDKGYRQRMDFNEASQLTDIINIPSIYTPLLLSADKQYAYDGNGQRTIQHDTGRSWLDLPQKRLNNRLVYSVHDAAGQLIFEDDLFSCKKTDFITLGKTKIARSDDQILDPNLDSDGDGITDCIESAIGLDSNNPDDALEDFDNDGLANRVELNLVGSFPFVADSDGDGYSDYRELVVDYTNPNRKDGKLGEVNAEDVRARSYPSSFQYTRDNDLDGLPAVVENFIGLNAEQARDSDQDGIADGQELLLGLDPTSNNGQDSLDLTLDSDGDGIPDAVEIALGLKHLDENDALDDEDGDGINNFQEFLAGTNLFSERSTPRTNRDLFVLNIGEGDYILHPEYYQSPYGTRSQRVALSANSQQSDQSI